VAPKANKQGTAAGIEMSQTLYDRAGFAPGQTVNNVLIR
jgi:hypothetical protein